MNKKIFSIFLVLTIFMSIFITPVFASEDEFNAIQANAIAQKTTVDKLKAKSAILVDGGSGKILFEKNIHEKLPIASVTKIMTMLLTMEAIDSGKIKLTDVVTVSDHATSMGGSQTYMKVGEQFKVEELLKAVAVHSANDCTVALAEKIAGSEAEFVKLMNQRAKELGMNDTNFLDSTGLTDDGHYSSANDVAIMGRELLMKHPKITDYTTIWHDTFRNGTFSLDNTNKLIRFYDGANGLKTGFTTKAGYCLTGAAKRNNLQLISVVLGEPDNNTRVAESKTLLDYGFANFEVMKVNSKNDKAGDAQIEKGVETTVPAIFNQDVNIIVPKGEKGKVEREVKYIEKLTAPIKKGQKVGEVIYKVNGKEVGKSEIVAKTDVEKASFIRLFFRMIISWFSFGKK